MRFIPTDAREELRFSRSCLPFMPNLSRHPTWLPGPTFSCTPSQ